MSRGNGSSRVGYFLVGLGLGAAVALLLAPQPGKRTRRLIAEKASRGKNYLSARGRQMGKSAEGAFEKSRGWVVKEMDRLSNLREVRKRVARDKFDA
jgi:gas vesicle protein